LRIICHVFGKGKLEDIVKTKKIYGKRNRKTTRKDTGQFDYMDGDENCNRTDIVYQVSQLFRGVTANAYHQDVR
jgi:hypothetical protein